MLLSFLFVDDIFVFVFVLLILFKYLFDFEYILFLFNVKAFVSSDIYDFVLFVLNGVFERYDCFIVLLLLLDFTSIF